MIAGHRDTHFAFLDRLLPGMSVLLAMPDGRQLEYRVIERRVVDVRQEPGPRWHTSDALLLVTCFPFDAITARGPLRYLVEAEPVDHVPLSMGHFAELSHSANLDDQRPLF